MVETEFSDSEEEKTKKHSRWARFQWLIDIFEKTEEEVYEEAGHEVVLYLVFMKYSAYLFLLVFLGSGFELTIMYWKLSFSDYQTLIFNNFAERISIRSFQGI